MVSIFYSKMHTKINSDNRDFNLTINMPEHILCQTTWLLDAPKQDALYPGARPPNTANFTLNFCTNLFIVDRHSSVLIYLTSSWRETEMSHTAVSKCCQLNGAVNHSLATEESPLFIYLLKVLCEPQGQVESNVRIQNIQERVVFYQSILGKLVFFCF